MNDIMQRMREMRLAKSLPNTLNIEGKRWVKDVQFTPELEQRAVAALLQITEFVNRHCPPETIDDTFIMKRFTKVV